MACPYVRYSGMIYRVTSNFTTRTTNTHAFTFKHMHTRSHARSYDATIRAAITEKCLECAITNILQHCRRNDCGGSRMRIKPTARGPKVESTR